MTSTGPTRQARNVEPGSDGVLSADVVVIGSGMGGANVALALAETGRSVLVVERGDFLPAESENWSPTAVFAQRRYKNAEEWLAADGRPFDPGVYYYVGGNTKLFGASLPRFRSQDFGAVEHQGGIAPAWPVSYDEMEPWYARAEQVFRVHADPGTDPTEPWRSTGYPYPAIKHEPAIADLAASLEAQGLRPFSMPTGVDVRPGGACIQCRTCDGFPCRVDAKSDADVRAMRPALASPTVRLLTRTKVDQLRLDRHRASVTEASATRDGQVIRLRAGQFVLACGAVNTAALLLRSEGPSASTTLGNSSGLVGRNYMVHNSTFFVAVDPRRRNQTSFQKTLGVNDWYTATSDSRWPLGNVQMLGKLQTPMVAGARPHIPKKVLTWATGHSVDLYLTSEDLPSLENRITLSDTGRIVVHWVPNNLQAHEELVRRSRRALRRAGFPFQASQRMGIETNSHQCGTAVMGTDPRTSVVSPAGHTHDVPNLWVADSAVFPSSAAVNPALTIAANAMRLAANLDRAGR
jgi:choline dehydrogenase-like flavoprotein